MSREVVIHTWCDIEFNEQQPGQNRVDGEVITWMLDGVRMELDLCPTHKLEITVGQMDELVRQYGRVWEDPEKPKMPRKRDRSRERRSRATRPEDLEIKDGYVNEAGEFVCTVDGCPREQVPIAKLQGFRLHQTRIHGIKVGDNT